VHSTARAGAAVTSRAKKLTRAKDDLDRLLPGLGGRFYPSQEKVTGRLQQIARDRKVGPYLRYTLGTAPADGREGTSTGQGSDHATGTPEAAGPGPADTWHGSGSGRPGKPALTWWFDQARGRPGGHAGVVVSIACLIVDGHAMFSAAGTVAVRGPLVVVDGGGQGQQQRPRRNLDAGDRLC